MKSLICPFSSADIAIITEHLLNNIATTTHPITKVINDKFVNALPGAVVAAPTLPGHCFSQDYYFHWVRDGAIVIRQIANLYLKSIDSDEKNRYKQIILEHLAFVKTIQSQPSLNGIDILGEPKFNLDGTLWTGIWARPQNDGAAYQALALTDIAMILLDEGQYDFVVENIYDPANKSSLLKENLEYCAANWSVKTIGPWEELLGYHFSVGIVERAALLNGAALANRLNDVCAASYYTDQASQLAKALDAHWNDSLGYYFEMLSEQNIKGGGIATAVIIGLIYGQQDALDDPFSLSSPHVLSTAFYVRSTFENLYQINVVNRMNDHSGPLIGRYSVDIYDGNQSTYGNPWFLCSNLLATFYYGVAQQLLAGQVLKVDFLVKQFLQQVAPSLHFQCGERIEAKHAQFAALVKQIVAQGDAILFAVKVHCITTDDGSPLHMSEQIDRACGQQVSATDLSWSYETLLRAVHARDTLMNEFGADGIV